MIAIQYVVLEEPSVKLSRLLIFDCAGIGISVPRPNLALLWANRSGIGCSNLCACSQSQCSTAPARPALKAKSYVADTPSYRMFLSAVQLLETHGIALDRRLARLSRHHFKNMNRNTER